MKKTVKISLIIFFLISIVLFVSLISAFFVLKGYSKSTVKDSLLDMANMSKETIFYHYDRASDSYEPIIIADTEIRLGEKYKFVSYNEIPNDIINAFISIEDKRFRTHNGIDYIRSSKAIVNYVFNGSRSFGGSTITQQLVKNITGNDQFSIDRKLREAFQAINIEKKLDKTQILESYLNIIYLSRGCRGISSAAEYYFSKELKDLTLNECACIAAITNNPSKYDPISHPENNKLRRNTILLCMLEQGYISQKDYQEALNSNLEIKKSSETSQNNINSWYIDMVIKDVVRDLSVKYECSMETASFLLYNGGYRIYTAMDYEVQSILDEYFANTKNFPIDTEGNMPQSSMIIIDPFSGDILGVAGAVGKKSGNRIQNFATDTLRPPGSTIKPLSVYAPALEMGIINWGSVFSDSPINEDSKWPSNANKKYVGDVNTRYAIENSLNTVPVKILREIGNDTSFNFLQDKLNFSTINKNNDIGDAALALGQPSRGVSLRELTCAYSIFEEGIYSNARSYYKVTDSSGRIILDNSYKQSKVLSKENAAIMTKLLQTVVANGTAAGRVSLSNMVEVAGKTGTTQNSFDKYFIGYTPGAVAGVWSGYEYPKSLDQFGDNFSILIWDDVMSQIYKTTRFKEEKRVFEIPNTVQELSFDKTTGMPLYESSDDAQIENGWFDVSSRPPS